MVSWCPRLKTCVFNSSPLVEPQLPAVFGLSNHEGFASILSKWNHSFDLMYFEKAFLWRFKKFSGAVRNVGEMREQLASYEKDYENLDHRRYF